MSLFALLLDEIGGTPPSPTNPPYILFKSTNTITINSSTSSKEWDGVVEYSVNGVGWSTWDGSAITAPTIYFRGTGNTKMGDGYAWTILGSNVECVGNLENLLDYQVTQIGGHPLPSAGAFSSLFASNASLINSFDYLGLSLANANDCFYATYQNCTGIKTAGTLAPTTLSEFCYQMMYCGCSSLLSMPDLPATTMAVSCYSGMFSDCTSLTVAKPFSATTLASECFSMMFANTGLTTAPALPLTTLADGCYNSMFFECNSLVTPPELPAKSATPRCYERMFYKCNALVTPPDIKLETLAKECCHSMFEECNSLVHAPKIKAKNQSSTSVGSAFSRMFYACPSLVEVPAFSYLNYADSDVGSIFMGCSSLKFSTAKTTECPYQYRFPAVGLGTAESGWSYLAFYGTSGTYTGDPAINTPYYTNAKVVYDNPPYILFRSDDTISINSYNSERIWDGAVQYSLDGSSWTTWQGTAISGNEIYFRGVGNSYINGTTGLRNWTVSGTNVECIGNLENLLDYQITQAGGHPVPASYCFYALFYGNSSIINAFDYLGESVANTTDCLGATFRNCSNLKKAGILTPTTLSTRCYEMMYMECPSLEEMPDLPATTLERECYSSMFCNDTSLVNIKPLPATNLAKACYYFMLAGTGVVDAPKLPAMTLEENCYADMFDQCNSLVNAPELPAKVAAKACYAEMFIGITKDFIPPDINLETLAESCCRAMFMNCTAMTHAPRIKALPSTVGCTTSYNHMLRRCTSLVEVPAFMQLSFGLQEAAALFYDDSSLKFSTSKTADCPNRYRFPIVGNGTGGNNWSLFTFENTGGSFTGNPGINATYYTNAKVIYYNPPFILFRSNSTSYITISAKNGKTWDGTIEYSTDGLSWTTWDGSGIVGTELYFRGTGNTKITGVGNNNNSWIVSGPNVECVGNLENLLDYQTTQAGGHPSPAAKAFAYMFSGMTSITTSFDYLGETFGSAATYVFDHTYANCTSLVSAGLLSPKTLSNGCYWGMYYGCDALTKAPKLPATTLGEQSYALMFYECISLANAPEIQATTLAKECCMQMFYGCTAMITAPALPAMETAEHCYLGMFMLSGVVNPPALPATVGARGCYRQMFKECTSLVTPPDIELLSVDSLSCAGMFQDCTSLVYAPRIAATSSSSTTGAFDSMFSGCTSLAEVPGFRLTVFSGSADCGSLFKGCTSLRFATTQSATYQNSYRFPTSGTGIASSNWSTSAFALTAGTFKSDPVINTTYYTNASVIS